MGLNSSTAVTFRSSQVLCCPNFNRSVSSKFTIVNVDRDEDFSGIDENESESVGGEILPAFEGPNAKRLVANPTLRKLHTSDTEKRSCLEIPSQIPSDNNMKKMVSFSPYFGNECKLNVSFPVEYVNPTFTEGWRLQNLKLKSLIHKSDLKYVWEAENSASGQRCALKIMLFEKTQFGSKGLNRVEPSLRQVAALNCSSIAKIYFFGSYECYTLGKQYTVLNICSELGTCNLLSLHRQKLQNKEEWSEAQLLRLVSAIYNAICAYISYSIQYKIKAENILLNSNMIDFFVTDFDPQIERFYTNSPSSSFNVLPSSVKKKGSTAGVQVDRVFLFPSQTPSPSRLEQNDSPWKFPSYSLAENDIDSIVKILMKTIFNREEIKCLDQVYTDSALLDGYPHVIEALRQIELNLSIEETNIQLSKILNKLDQNKDAKFTYDPLAKSSQLHPIDVLLNKIQVYSWLDNFEAAEVEYLETMSLFKDKEKKSVQQYQDYIRCGNTIIKHLLKIGDFLKANTIARDLYRQSKMNDGFKIALRKDLKEYSVLTLLMGDLREKFGDHGKALGFYSKGLHYCNQIKVPAEIYRDTIKNFITLSMKKGKYNELIECLRDLIGFKNNANIESSDAFIVMGDFHLKQGNKIEAEEFYTRAYEIAKNQKDEEMQLESVKKLFNILKTLEGRDEVILAYEMEVINIKRKRFGCDSREFLNSLELVARTNKKLKNFESARRYYEALSDNLTDLNLTQSTEYSTALLNLANMCYTTDKYDTALKYYQQCAELSSMDDPKQMKMHIDVQDGMAKVLFKQRKYKQSLDIQTSNLKIKHTYYGDYDRYIIIAYNNIGDTYYTVKRYDQALKHHQRSLELAKNKAGGTDSNDMDQILLNIAFDYKKLGNYGKGLDHVYLSLKIYKNDGLLLLAALDTYENDQAQRIIGLNFSDIKREVGEESTS